ncbi:NCAPH2 isoform 5 [Pongo abelii]|uniref:Condensin-2 complex subunit H2 n=1 Tax=Pongo abelii TaxID=9601 RepID=A0A2J8XTL4_PONAB|nr:NCAPH2 isoform 5 [Pongo abelii]
MEDVEARFAHLLQPIRDLTKNWEVDVAAQLGEYLEECHLLRRNTGDEPALGKILAGSDLYFF